MRKLHYNNFAEYVNEADKAPEYFTNLGSLAIGLGTKAQAIHFARNGWPEGTARIKAQSTLIVDKIRSLIEVPRIVYDVTGIDFDMGLHVSQTPESWYDFRNEIQEGSSFRVLKFVYNFGARAYVSNQTLEARGFTAAALVILLELSGFRVEITAVNRVEWRGTPMYDFRIPVKAADQPLDIDRLAFIFAHPAMLRKLGFGIRHTYASEIGGSIDVEPSEQGDIYIDSGTGSQWADLASAQEWITSRLAEQGVQIHA